MSEPDDFGRIPESLAPRYPLLGLHMIRALPTTGRNMNVVMADATDARFVFRCYRRNTNPDRIKFQLDYQEHLLGKGIPIADVIRTHTGERFVSDGRHTWVLFQYVAGQSYDYGSEEQLRNAARCLSDLHDAAEDFVGTPFVDATIPDVRRWWTHGAEDLDRLHIMFNGRDVDRELAFLDRWLVDLTHTFPLDTIDRAPKRWVHADFHGGNLAFRGGHVSGVFDFDVVHRGFRLEDIAHGSFCFSRENSASNRVRPRLADMFQKAFDLTDLEREALPAILVATQARNAARYQIREREGTDSAAVLRRHVARMAELAASLKT